MKLCPVSTVRFLCPGVIRGIREASYGIQEHLLVQPGWETAHWLLSVAAQKRTLYRCFVGEGGNSHPPWCPNLCHWWTAPYRPSWPVARGRWTHCCCCRCSEWTGWDGSLQQLVAWGSERKETYRAHARPEARQLLWKTWASEDQCQDSSVFSMTHLPWDYVRACPVAVPCFEYSRLPCLTQPRFGYSTGNCSDTRPCSPAVSLG